MLDLVFENSSFLAVAKESGVDVHNSENSLLEQLKAKFQQDFFPVHRLDSGTSGVLILAKSADSARLLSHLFQSNKINKQYILISKKRPYSEIPPEGSWDDPISNKAEGRKNPAGKKTDRVEAKTLFQVLEQNQHYIKMEVSLITGRTHQIRKHCALHSLPIVGDTRYGNELANRIAKEHYGFSRLALHCKQLSFFWDGEELNLSTPEPKDFSKLFV